MTQSCTSTAGCTYVRALVIREIAAVIWNPFSLNNKLCTIPTRTISLYFLSPEYRFFEKKYVRISIYSSTLQCSFHVPFEINFERSFTLPRNNISTFVSFFRLILESYCARACVGRTYWGVCARYGQSNVL